MKKIVSKLLAWLRDDVEWGDTEHWKRKHWRAYAGGAFVRPMPPWFRMPPPAEDD